MKKETQKTAENKEQTLEDFFNVVKGGFNATDKRQRIFLRKLFNKNDFEKEVTDKDIEDFCIIIEKTLLDITEKCHEISKRFRKGEPLEIQTNAILQDAVILSLWLHGAKTMIGAVGGAIDDKLDEDHDFKFSYHADNI